VLPIHRRELAQRIQTLRLKVNAQPAAVVTRIAPALKHQAAARRDITARVARQLPAEIHQGAHHCDIGIVGYQQQPAGIGRAGTIFERRDRRIEQY